MSDIDILKEKCKDSHFEKLARLNNNGLLDFIAGYTKICNPESVFVRTDSLEDSAYIRKRAVESGEEALLGKKGHTVHFDGMHDQARDKGNTKFLLGPGMNLGREINSVEEEEGVEEIHGLLENIMAGKEMFILFMCLGPVDSQFSIYAVQLTDSSYVAHSEDILFRPAYEIFRRENVDCFKYVHSAGELEKNVSKNVHDRRVYVDLLKNTVYSVNTQYAGNTVGLKKLALRLAIKKASGEGWLAEHMFVMGVHGRGGRKNYFLGAFPSFCGKTSTSMVKGESVVGDDIAYLRKREGKVYAANVERGMFGIIRGVNEKNDPLIWDVLTEEGEIIFSNVLIKDGLPRWNGDEKKEPDSGINFSGSWFKGKFDENGEEISFSHPNARYTVRLESLKNCDENLEKKEGVEVKGIIYGGRDSDTWPPVFESFDWTHGVITMASSLESETTAATLGKVGVRNFNPMANLDFLSIPVSKYVENHLNFMEDVKNKPVIFGVNYFLRGEDGNYLSEIEDKRVWLKWMELRVNGEAGAIKSPIGLLPEYGDLKMLFRDILSKDFSEENYHKCFDIRVSRNVEKIERIINIYRNIKTTPEILFEVLESQKTRLQHTGGEM